MLRPAVRFFSVFIAAMAIAAPASAGQLPGEVAVPRIVDHARSYLGSRYGGVWLTHSGGHLIVHAGVVDPQRGDFRSLSIPLPRVSSLEIAAVRYSLRELEAFSDEAIAVVDRARLWDDPVVGIAVDAPRNRVRIDATAGHSGLMGRLARELPKDSFAVRIDPTATGLRSDYLDFVPDHDAHAWDPILLSALGLLIVAAIALFRRFLFRIPTP